MVFVTQKLVNMALSLDTNPAIVHPTTLIHENKYLKDIYLGLLIEYQLKLEMCLSI